VSPLCSFSGASPDPLRRSGASPDPLRRSGASPDPLRRSGASPDPLRRSPGSAQALRRFPGSAQALTRIRSGAQALTRIRSGAQALPRIRSGAQALTRIRSGANHLRCYIISRKLYHFRYMVSAKNAPIPVPLRAGAPTPFLGFWDCGGSPEFPGIFFPRRDFRQSISRTPYALHPPRIRNAHPCTTHTPL
jgi:hypothetical protein